MSEVSIVEKDKTALKNALSESKLPWTPQAQAVLERAQEQAREDGFDIVGTEHIVFGIVSVRECLGATVLENLGVTSSKLSGRYEQLSKPSDQTGAGKAKFSEDIEKVIRCAHEQATDWGHEYVGAEHLLAGIFLAGTGKGFQILTDLGITLEKVREETGQLVVCRSTHNERKGK